MKRWAKFGENICRPFISKKYKELEILNSKRSIQLEIRQRYEEIFHQIIYTNGKRTQWDIVW